MLSREMSRLDNTAIMGLFDSISKRYRNSNMVLNDMLPEHVVNSLIRTGSGTEILQEASRSYTALDPLSEDWLAASPSDGLSNLSLLRKAKSELHTSPSLGQMTNIILPSKGHGLPQGNAFSKHECCTIFFSDLVGFSTWAHKVEPEDIMATLHDLYTRLDNIILRELPMLYKIETIGDAYVVAANVIDPDPMHALHTIQFALRAQEEASKVPRPDCEDGGDGLQMRIGLHSGSVVSGLVGQIRKRFCLFGHAVNMTARTESSCPPGCVQLTEACYKEAESYLKGKDIEVTDRGLVQVKGADEPLHMYLATRIGSKPVVDLSKILLASQSTGYKIST
jgi:class 3 adenylate cyclase